MDRITEENFVTEVRRLYYSEDFWRMKDQERIYLTIMRAESKIVHISDEVLYLTRHKKYLKFSDWFYEMRKLLSFDHATSDVKRILQKDSEDVISYIFRVFINGREAGMSNYEIFKMIRNGLQSKFKLLRKYLLNKERNISLRQMDEISRIAQEDKANYESIKKQDLQNTLLFHNNNEINLNWDKISRYPYQTIKINNVSCDVLFDTGSRCNFMSVPDVERLSLKKEKCKPCVKFYTCTGEDCRRIFCFYENNLQGLY